MNSFSYRSVAEKRAKKKMPAIAVAILVGLFGFFLGLRVDEVDLYALLSEPKSTNQHLPEDLDYSSVEEVYDALRRNYDGDLNEDDLLDGLKSGLAKASGDPYTVYLDEEQAAQFTNDLNGTFTGIGAEISLEDEVITVVAPLDGFPAERAGLRSRDKIIKIDETETFGMTVEDAVLAIRGPENTDVTLTILRNNEQKEITITREKIVIPSVTYEVEEGIGYLRISRFAEDTAQLSREAAQDFASQKVTGVVLDLRNNSGGFLDSAVEVSSLWLEGVPVVQQRENSGATVTNTLNAKNNAPLKDVPTVVLINEGSASASEIVAGALGDYEAATLVGTTSYGKGSVQTLNSFADDSVLKVTVARWYTPNGINIDHEGIVPDVEVELTAEDIEAEKDPQKQRAFKIIKDL